LDFTEEEGEDEEEEESSVKDWSKTTGKTTAK
jgi:hypothetical protein